MVLAILALGAVLHLGRAVLAPLVIAVVLSLLLAPVVRGLGRLGITPPFAAALTIAALLGAIGWGAWILAEPAGNWLAELPRTLEQVTLRLDEMRGPLDRVDEAAEQVERMTEADGKGVPLSVEVRDVEGSASSRLLVNVRALFGSVLVVVALAYFLLADADSFLRSSVRVLPRLRDKKLAVTVIRGIETRISRYLLTITLVNLALGTVIAGCMALTGMPSPLLWGAMATALNYVPYVGAAVGVTIVGAVAFLSFDALGDVLLPPFSYLVATSLEGLLLTPSLLGRQFLLRPAILFVWLILWSALWGIPGALLAVPLLVMLKILCDNVEGLAAVSEFLGRDTETMAWRRSQARSAALPCERTSESV